MDSQSFTKNVRMLKREDVVILQNGDVLTPNHMEMAKLKKAGQFKTEVEFFRNMTAFDVKHKIEESFPILVNKRFSCAKRKAQNDARLEFLGDHRVWDGRTISRELRGGSALYIVMEDKESFSGTAFSSPVQDHDLQNVNNQQVSHRLPQSATTTSSANINSPANEMDIKNGVLWDEDISGPDIDQVVISRYLDFEEFKEWMPFDDFQDIPDVPADMDSSSFNRQSQIAQGDLSSTDVSNDPPNLTREIQGQKKNQVPSTSTSGRSDTGLSSEKSSSQGQALNQLTCSTLTRADVRIKPSSGLLEGGDSFYLEFDKNLPESVKSAWATFGKKDIRVWKTYEGCILHGKSIPPGEVPGPVPVTITTQNGDYLGETQFTYVDQKKKVVEDIVSNKRKLADFFSEVAKQFKSDASEENTTQTCQRLAVPNQMEAGDILKLLVYTAAQTGAEGFIRFIFSSSAGQIVFEAYRNESLLPEHIAEANGHEKIAVYIREITERFAEEDRKSQTLSKGIDWLELAKAVEESEEQFEPFDGKDVAQLREDDTSERAYFGDAETSSDSEKERSDSEDSFKSLLDIAEEEGPIPHGNVEFLEKGSYGETAGEPCDFSELKGTAPPEKIEECSSQGTVTTNTGGAKARAIPLCLPDNCLWNSKTCQCVQTREERSSLYVVEEALEELRKVKGPVCVVSVAGPYRKGKSYILSEAFDQPEVFPLGHEMVAETMGIWLWIVPEKYKDSRNQEFTVVLLDSEGIDAANSKGHDDNQIFTLTVLLASMLIYNSQGVPTRRDLEGLDFIVKLSQRIQIRSTGGGRLSKRFGTKETEFFHRTFPFFIWLLRDVTQSIPPDCKDIKDYFLKKVFRDQDSQTATGRQSKQIEVAESILRFFPGFEAFTLPLPTANGEVMKSLNENKHKLESQFLNKLEDFKGLLKSNLIPKQSCTDREFVTGEGLAALVTLYVEAINTPGAIPNVQGAWDTFVQAKFLDAKQASLQEYTKRMTSLLSGKLPCDNDEIRYCHNTALEESEGLFMSETTGISTNTVERHMRELKIELNKQLNQWQTENAKQTKQFCDKLLLQLKRKHLDPVLQQLQGSDGSKLSFDDIIEVYHLIKEDYDARAVGAKDAIAAAFFDFHPELAKETKRYLELLRELKNFDEKAAKEMAEEAYRERERRRLEEKQLCLQQENREHKQEMEMLIGRSEKERTGLREQMANELKVQQDQLQNMMAASMKQAEREREAFIKENRALEERLLAMQKSNEENMKMIKNMSELMAKHEEEKLEFRSKMTALPKDEMEASLEIINERHTKEVTALLEKMDIQIDGIKKIKESGDDEALHSAEKEKERAANLEELPQLMTSRAQMVGSLQQRMAETEKEREAVEKPSYMKQGLRVVARVAPLAGKAFSLYTPYAEPLGAVVGDAAVALSECDCSIM